MALTRQEKDVFGLAYEILECNGVKAMDHAAATRVQSSAKPGQRSAVVWAVDYLACLPTREELRGLVVRAHICQDDEQWTQQDIRRCGGAMRGFYRRLHEGRLYSEGLFYLEMMEGQ